MNGRKRPFRRLVVKFGGSSLADGLRISRAVDSVVKKARDGVQMVVVVSAIGKTTDLLIDTADEASGTGVRRDELDDIVAMGERTSARIFAAALKARGQVSCLMDPCEDDWPIVTDDTFTNAKPILPICEEETRRHVEPLLEKGTVVVVPGFIGKTEQGAVTTMGRGGSDSTALVLGRALSADQVILVTDVEGVMTADPKIVRDPQRLSEISMDALIGLADSGAKFIHSKALRYKVPSVDIKVINSSSGDLDTEGTVIHGSFPGNIAVELYPEPAMAVTVVGKEASESHQTLASLLQEIRKAGAPLLGMSINHNSLIFYLPLSAGHDLIENLHSTVVRDERSIALAVRKDLAFIRIKGIGFEETPGIISDITKALNLAGINIYGAFTITSSVLIFVDLKDKEKAVGLIEGAIGRDG